MRDRGWIVAHAVVLIAGIAPIIAVTYVPTLDLPNHIARIFVAQGLPQSAALRQFYTYNWAFVPNLAFDVFVLGIGRIVGILLAAKLFMLIAAALLYIGTVLLHRVQQRHFSVIPMAAVVLIYNGAYLFGFANYVMGVGLSLCATAAWIAARDLPLRLHAPLFAVIGVALISVHLFGFGLFGLAVLGFELDQVFAAWRRMGRFPRHAAARMVVRGLSPSIPPLLLFFAISPTASGIERNVMSTPFWKAEALTGPLLFYFTTPEILVAAIFVTVFAVALLLRIIVVRQECLIGLGLMLAVFLVMPRTLVSSGYADYRMPSAIALYTLAALDWHPQARARSVLATSVALLIADVGKVTFIGASWLAWQPALAAYAVAFQQLPPGAVLLTIDGSSGSVSRDRQPPISHMGSLAAARGVLVPTLYGDEPGFLLSIVPRYRDLRHLAPLTGANALSYLARYGARYTHLLVNRPQLLTLPPEFTYAKLASGPTFDLYSLAPSPAK